MITFRLLRISHGDSLIAMGLLGLSGLHVIFLLLGKAVHGSVPGRVCAQPGTNPTRSVGQKFNPPPTSMVDRIGRIGPSTDGGQFGWSWRSENRPKSGDLTAKFR